MANVIEAVLDKVHPKHVGHTKTYQPILALMFRATCSCGDVLNVSLATMLLSGVPSDTFTFKGIKGPEKDPHFPSECPRCKGPAYIGGNNNVDCKRGCS